MSDATKQVHVRLPESAIRQLDRQARSLGIPRSALLKVILSESTFGDTLDRRTANAISAIRGPIA
ncbi:MAG: ribbon-helix-helix protein, CopG family [Polyangiaceae bacterium]